MMHDWTVTTDEERTKSGFSGALFMDLEYQMSESSKDRWKMSLSLCGSTRHNEDWRMFLIHTYFHNASILEFQVHDNCSLFKKIAKLHHRYRDAEKLWRANKLKSAMDGWGHPVVLTEEEKKGYFEMIIRGAVMYSSPVKLLMAASKICDSSYHEGVRNNQEKIRKALGIDNLY